MDHLDNAGLITTERRGKYLIAGINGDTIDDVNKVLAFRRNKS